MSSKEEIAILVGHVVSFDDHIEKLAAAKSNRAHCGSSGNTGKCGRDFKVR